jgi:DNA primase
MKYDLEALNNISIDEVLEIFGGRRSKKARLLHCPNVTAHKNGDKNASMSISLDKNICKCFACGLKGNPISIATFFLKDFKKGCEFLHDKFNIPYLEDDRNDKDKNQQYDLSHFKKKKNEIKYFKFDANKEFYKIAIKDYLHLYKDMNSKQKLRLIYTFIYRYSLTTNQEKKIAYYKSRKLENSKYLKYFGFLDKKDIVILEEKLKKYFDVEDLIKFKIFNTYNKWKYGYSMSVVPSFSLYTDLIEGLMLRYTDNRTKGKETNISYYDIVYPMPFGLGRKTILTAKEIWITEGHIDALSIALKKDVSFVAFSGVYAWKVELFGLLKGKTAILAYDKDTAGQEGQNVLIKTLQKAGVNCKIAEWDNNYKDLNELLVADKIDEVKIIETFK